jgi:hypothetical protein
MLAAAIEVQGSLSTLIDDALSNELKSSDRLSTGRNLQRPLNVDYVEKLCLIGALVPDSVLLGVGDSADDGRAAGDAGGAVLRLQP